MVMAPGPPDKRQSSRFAILSDFIDQPYKNIFPTLPNAHLRKIS